MISYAHDLKYGKETEKSADIQCTSRIPDTRVAYRMYVLCYRFTPSCHYFMANTRKRRLDYYID